LRILIFILFIAFIPARAICQQPTADTTDLAKDSSEEDDDEDAPPPVSFAFYYSKAFDLYVQGYYSQAEIYFRKAFHKFKCSEAAEYVYYSLARQGYDMEAQAFRNKNKDYIPQWPDTKKSIEKIYLYAGPRLSATSGVSNVYYANGGFNARLSDKISLWQSVDYTTQSNNLGSFKQYGSFTHLDVYFKKGWYLAPSFCYAYTPNTTLVSQSRIINYIKDYSGAFEKISYQTYYNQDIAYTLPGVTNSFNASVSLSKRIHDLTFEVEPSWHYIQSKNNGVFQYHSVGTVDSFVNNKMLGSAPYADSGYGHYDSTSGNFIYQLGVAVAYKWPIRHQPLTTRFAAYYLEDNNENKAYAFHFFTLWQIRHDLWLHFSWVNKGNLPWVLNYEGLYYNFTDQIKTRAGLTLQLYPLKRFSPLLTYQYEQDTRSQDNATLTYRSFFLTLKYSL